MTGKHVEVRQLRDPKALPKLMRDLVKRNKFSAEASDIIEHAADELESAQTSFDLRWDADMRAIKRWQDTTGKTKTWPDHSDLCTWLLEQVEALSSH